jgi:hypothetical protein
VHGSKPATGKPIVANNPHREVTNPSLRYIVRLNAPGWNVVGASESPFVGVHIGHNDRLEWGLTITGTDQHDVFVEEVNPANANEVRYNGTWEPLHRFASSGAELKQYGQPGHLRRRGSPDRQRQIPPLQGAADPMERVAQAIVQVLK